MSISLFDFQKKIENKTNSRNLLSSFKEATPATWQGSVSSFDFVRNNN
jgi:hypothetical protein